MRLPSYCLNTESGANIKDTYLRVCQEFVLLLAIDCSLQSPSLKVAARDRSEQDCNAEMSSLRLALNQHRERRAGSKMLTILTFCCEAWLTPLRTSDPSNALFQLPPSMHLRKVASREYACTSPPPLKIMEWRAKLAPTRPHHRLASQIFGPQLKCWVMHGLET